jgi:EAL domain-containing protein (putative c-di-GMP-specific phosphodiesterase class I)
MLKWGSISERSRRASDVGTVVPAVPVRDLVLEAAIAHEQVNLLYQPLLDVRTGRIACIEALVRSPIARSAEALFARAEAAALGERLSRLIQRKALRCAAVWEGPLRHLGISINLLPADISREGYERWLLDEIGAAAIDPRRITLEITESALLVDQPAAVRRLGLLRDAGIAIAVDDFGTGYASFAYLTALPLDLLKIDRGLVGGIVSGTRDRIVVKAMIALARELGLKVAVEGVEDEAQRALLAEWGCDLYQGFLAAAPMTHEELTDFVAATQVDAAA